MAASSEESSIVPAESPLIRPDMTLPELVAAANSHLTGHSILPESDYVLLVALLRAYAEDVLNIGQCVQLDSVTLSKGIENQVAVVLQEGTCADDERPSRKIALG